jgi:hypothetical protein
MKKSLILILVYTMLFSANTYAGLIINQLYNTGLDSNGIALTDLNGSEDAFWTVRLANTSNINDLAAITYKHNAYSADTGNSRWISIDSTGGNSTTSSSTNYIFTTTFDLTGYNASTAMITGLWGIDNYGSIWLNGNDTGNTLSFGYPAFRNMHELNISNFFIEGINTLTVQLTNGHTDPNQDPGPMALRLDNLQLSANYVPEPTPISIFAVFLLLLASMRANIFYSDR